MPLFNLFQKPNIEKAIANRDVNGLIKALSYLTESDQRAKQKSVEQLVRVIVLLGEIGDIQAVEPLIDQTRFSGRLVYTLISEEEIAVLCAEALANIGDERALEPLHTLFGRVYQQSLSIRLIKSIKKFGKPIPAKLIEQILHEPLRIIKEVDLSAINDSNLQKYIEQLDAMGELAIETLVSWLNLPSGFVPRSGNDWTQHTPKRILAAYQLRKLGWQPDNDADKLTFFVLARDWDKLGGLVLPISHFGEVRYLFFAHIECKDDKPFAGYLSLYHNKNIGIGTATILVKWYQDKTVDDNYKIRILDVRDKILACNVDFPV